MLSDGSFALAFTEHWHTHLAAQVSSSRRRGPDTSCCLSCSFPLHVFPSSLQVLAHWDKAAEQVAAEDAAAQEAGQLLHELFSQGITLCDLPWWMPAPTC